MLDTNLFKEKSFLEHKSIVQGISVLQVLTGIGGFATLYDAFQNEAITSYIAFIIFIPIFVLDIIGGMLLFRNRMLGFRISLVMQLIHSIKFGFFGLNFGASIPIYFYLTLKFFRFEFGFDTGFGTTDITFFTGVNEPFISLNIITVVLAIFLFKIQKKQTTTSNFN